MKLVTASETQCAGLNVPLGTKQVISEKAVDCTGADNQTTTKWKYNKHKKLSLI